MEFTNPHYLWLILLIPLLSMGHYLTVRARARSVEEQFGEAHLLERFNKALPPVLLLGKVCLFALTMLFLVMALARPIKSNGSSEFPIGTIDVVAVVDVSRSMAVPDYKDRLPPPYEAGRRLDMAKYLLLTELIGSLNYNRLGVVTYAGEAFPQAFLTDDLPALKWVLSRAVSVGSAPGEGSAMAGAFELAFALLDLDSVPSHRRVVVLFSDGGIDSTSEEIAAVIKALKKRDIELVVVGLGKLQPSAIPSELLSKQDRFFNEDHPWYEVDGQIVTSGLEENALLLLKNRVNGRYVRVVESSDFVMTSMISRLETLRKPGQEEYFPWLLIASFLCFLVGVWMPNEVDPESLLARPWFKFRQ